MRPLSDRQGGLVCAPFNLVAAERWRPIDRFKVGHKFRGQGAFYEVSSLGRVRRGDRIRRQMLNSSGYPCVSFWVNGNAKQIPVHHLVLEAFVGPRPEGHVIRHLNGVRTNSALSNLCYGTPVENEADKEMHGTRVVGVKHHSNKLTEATVSEIRRRYVPRDRVNNAYALAREFGVDPTTVERIIKRRIWKHVP